MSIGVCQDCGDLAYLYGDMFCAKCLEKIEEQEEAEDRKKETKG